MENKLLDLYARRESLFLRAKVANEERVLPGSGPTFAAACLMDKAHEVHGEIVSLLAKEHPLYRRAPWEISRG